MIPDAPDAQPEIELMPVTGSFAPQRTVRVVAGSMTMPAWNWRPSPSVYFVVLRLRVSTRLVNPLLCMVAVGTVPV